MVGDYRLEKKMIDLSELVKNLHENYSVMKKKEILKTLATIFLLRENRNKRMWIHIYNNYPIGEEIVDLYFEDLKDMKTIMIKLTNSENKIEQSEKYLNEIPLMNTEKRIVFINTRKIGDTLEEMEKAIEEKLKNE